RRIDGRGALLRERVPASAPVRRPLHAQRLRPLHQAVARWRTRWSLRAGPGDDDLLPRARARRVAADGADRVHRVGGRDRLRMTLSAVGPTPPDATRWPARAARGGDGPVGGS